MNVGHEKPLISFSRLAAFSTQNFYSATSMTISPAARAKSEPEDEKRQPEKSNSEPPEIFGVISSKVGQKCTLQHNQQFKKKTRLIQARNCKLYSFHKIETNGKSKFTPRCRKKINEIFPSSCDAHNFQKPTGGVITPPIRWPGFGDLNVRQLRGFARCPR